MARMIEFYNLQVEEYKEKCKHFPETAVDDFVDNEPKKISWSHVLKQALIRHEKREYLPDSMVQCLYRPFCKQHLYFHSHLIHSGYQMPRIFPEQGAENTVIHVSGIGVAKDFSVIISKNVLENQTLANGQSFPLYTYERVDCKSKILVKTEDERVGDYVRQENISDTMLQKFRKHYGNNTIMKEDIFYYVYGILHSRSYRERFAADLKKQLPRIPMVDDFCTFSQAGRKLAELHLNYETGKMYPVVEVWGQGFGDSPAPLSPASFRMTKMRFPSKTDKSRIIYNDQLHLAGIPAETYSYIVNGKSALEWIMERYAVTTHKDSGIVNDPNDWCKEQSNERYIVDLIKRIVHLSVESVKIIEGLPEVRF